MPMHLAADAVQTQIAVSEDVLAFAGYTALQGMNSGGQ